MFKNIKQPFKPKSESKLNNIYFKVQSELKKLNEVSNE